MSTVSMASADTGARHRPVGHTRETPDNDRFFDLLPNAATLLAADGRVKRINTAFQRQFGYRPPFLVGRSWLEIIHPDDHAALRQALFTPGALEANQAEPLYRLEHRLTDQGGFVHQVAAAAAADVASGSWLITIHDVTRMRAVTARMRHALTALSSANERLQQFASAASHDIQEPLRAITNYLALLRDYHGAELAPEAQLYLHSALDSTDRLRAFIDDLLQYARLDTIEHASHPVNMGLIMQGVVHNLQTAIDDRGATVTWDELPTVVGHRAQLLQLFQNLISNAIKYNERTPVVTIRCAPDDNMARFSVADNGIGIPPEHRKSIFEIFRRLHPRNEYSGTGIGLALCQRIVQRHGGRIWVESEPDRGTTFHFTLPLS